MPEIAGPATGFGTDGDGCPPNTEVYKLDGTPKQCDLITNPTCPAGYSCQYNANSSKYQCCGKPPAPGKRWFKVSE